MPDGLTVNDVLKLTDPDGFGGSEVSKNELRYIAQGEGIVPFMQIEKTIESNIGKDVSPDDIQAAAQALLDISKNSFDGDLDATIEFMRDAVNENPEIGNMDFAEAVNSGAAAEFVNQTRAEQQAVDAARTSPPTESVPAENTPPTQSTPTGVSGETEAPSGSPTAVIDEALNGASVDAEQAEIEARIEALAESEPTESTPPTATTDTPSTLDGLSERFRANESVNESGFAEGIVVRQTMPNLDGDFGGAAQPVSPESYMDDLKYAQTSKVLESVGMDSGTVLADNKVQDYEFAQTISKAGYKTVEGDPDLKVENLTQENYPEAYDKAMEFGESMNLDISNNPEIVIGLMAVEVSGNDAIMNAMMEAQRDQAATQTAPEMNVPEAVAADPSTDNSDQTIGMKM